MAKQISHGKKSQSEVELEPDAWERFERAVKIVAKSPPQPKVKKKITRRKTRL